MAMPFPVSELAVIDATIRMFVEPVLEGDIEHFAAVWQQERDAKQALLDELRIEEKDLQSANLFRELLEAEGVEIVMKQGKHRLIPAFAASDQFMKDLLDDENERVATLAAARLAAKSTIGQTRAERFGWMTKRGPLTVYLNYCGAHTTRWSGGDKTNFQNPPPSLRKGIKAPAGHKLAIFDASQIECIAEGQLVATRDRGLVPIELVSVDDFVWDGLEWVQHEGVVYRGEKEVITYDGLTATPDHIVYTGWFPHGVALGALAEMGLSIQPARCEAAIREAALRVEDLPWIQDLWSPRYPIQVPQCAERSLLGHLKLAARYLFGFGDRSEGQRRPLRAGQPSAFHPSRECEQSLYDVLGADAERIAFGHAGFQTSVPYVPIWTRPYQGYGRDWFYGRRHTPAVAHRVFQDDVEETAPEGLQASARLKTEKVKVYDLLNAGPRYRFTVSGAVVSNCRILNYVAGQEDVVERFRNGEDPYVNVASEFYKRPITKKENPTERQVGKILELQCGFGSGGAKIKATLRVKANILLDDNAALQARDAYRSTHPRVVEYWKEAEMCIKRMHALLSYDWGPLRVECDIEKETRRIILPNGAPLIYDTLEQHTPEATEDDPRPSPYWRIRTRDGWQKMYGAKLVENVVQAMARTVLAPVIVKCAQNGIKVATTTHDDIVCVLLDEPNIHDKFELIRSWMKESPAWLPGIPLDCEGHLTDRYEKG